MQVKYSKINNRRIPGILGVLLLLMSSVTKPKNSHFARESLFQDHKCRIWTARFTIFAVLISVMTCISLPSRTFADAIVGSPIDVGPRPSSIYIDHAGVFAYVINSDTSISKIDISSSSVVATLSSVGVSRMVINSTDTIAYITNNNEKKITKLDLTNFTVAATITISGSNIQPTGIALNNSESRVYITDINSNKMYVVTASTFTLTSTITLNASFYVGFANDIVVDSDDRYAYIGSSSKILKVNLETLTIDSTIAVSFLQDMSMNSDQTKIFYRSCSSSCSLKKVDLVTGSEEGSFEEDELAFNGFVINSQNSIAYLAGSFELIKVNLNTMSAVSRTSISSISGFYLNRAVFGNNAKSIIYASATNIDSYSGNGKIIKFSLSTGPDPQVITFDELTTKLSSSATFLVLANASSGLAVSFTSSTPSICSVTSAVVTVLKVGVCTIDADQAGGSGWAQATRVSRSFSVLPAPPIGEAGVSVNAGDTYTNSKSVKLNLVWPEYATEARISTDGGFSASKTRTVALSALVDWELDDAVKGVYTKVVYMRFNGSGIDTTKTYSDDIILDTTAPVIESSTALAASGSIDLSLKVTDDITGVDKVQIKNGAKVVTKNYEPKISVTENELGLSASSATLSKTDVSSIEFRASDKAGNWTAYQNLSVSRAQSTAVATPSVATSAPIITSSKSATAKSIATFAKLAVSSTSKLSLKVLTSSAKYCKVVGSTLKGLKAGSCKVTVTVTPKKGNKTSKTVTLKVTK